MNEWNIQSRAHGCQACNKGFADKQSYRTLLLDLKPDIQRRDVCEDCWKVEQEDTSDRKGFISQWQGVYEAPPAAPPDPIQKENAETLLRKIMETNEPRYAAASYILAVMLERKRLLKVKEQFKRDGQRFFVYEQPRTGDIFTIPDPDLHLNELEQVQRDVGALLENGFVPAASAVASVAAADEQAASLSEAPIADAVDQASTNPHAAEVEPAAR